MPRVDAYISSSMDTVEEPELISVIEPEPPFRILVAGNLTGGARNRNVVEIDRDNFDSVLATFAPELRVTFGGSPLTIRIRELDDFHPDRLFATLAPFAALRDLRSRLSNTETFRAAAAGIFAFDNPPRMESRKAKSGEGLADVLGISDDWDRAIREIVARHATPRPDPRQPELIAQTDAAIAHHMCAVLHHPAFHEVEAAWRGVDFLVRRLETGSRIEIHVLDVPKDELLSDAGLAALRYELSAQEWALIAGLYEVAPGDEPALMRIAALARSAHAPFIAGLAPDALAVDGAFAALRRSPDASYIGLAFPRFLLRLPYGRETVPAETFDFEEMPSPPQHERYLWGHPAIACALLLGEAFSQRGWELVPDTRLLIDGLPVHVCRLNGDAEARPCAEVQLTEDEIDGLLDCGYIPLVAIRGTDSVRVARIQSITDPPSRLSGRW